jgi:hypothetical protein
MPKYLIQSSAPQGHRRAGLTIPPTGIEIEELSKEQLAALRADPRVVLAELPAEKKSGKAADGNQ